MTFFSRSRKKKANIGFELVTVLIVLATILVGALVGSYVLGTITDDIVADPEMTNVSKEFIQDWDSKFPSFFDGLIIFIFVGLWIVGLVSAYMVDTHPLFFVVSLLMLVFFLFISMIIGNAYYDVSLEDPFSALTSSFPMSHWIMTHILEMSILVGITIIMVLYGKHGR